MAEKTKNFSFKQNSFFRDYQLHKDVQHALRASQFMHPTYCQAEVIPHLLAHENVVCHYPTGSGKTDSYLIPFVNEIASCSLQQSQYLIIVPTWELGYQIYQRCLFFAEHVVHLSVRFYSAQTQINFTKQQHLKARICILTVGKLEQLIHQNKSLITKVTHLVFDEFDFLLDASFRDELIKLCHQLHNLQCISAFSATMSQNMHVLCRQLIGNFHTITPDRTTKQKNITHWLYYQMQKSDVAIVQQLLTEINPYFCLIFARSAQECRLLFNALKKKTPQIAFFDASLQPNQRKQLIQAIQKGVYRYVVCSDLVARGLDFADVSDVISVHLPYEWEYYIHRAGRTGRLNKPGNCYLIINEQEKPLLTKFDQYKIAFQVYNKKTLTKQAIKRHNSVFQNKQLQRNIQVIIAKSERKNVKPNYKKRRAKVINCLKKRHFFRELDRAKRKRK